MHQQSQISYYKSLKSVFITLFYKFILTKLFIPEFLNYFSSVVDFYFILPSYDEESIKVLRFAVMEMIII
jgi:hypothetical protein